MPLHSGSSHEAFVHNVKVELAAGKPRDQALAIAYSKQRGDATSQIDQTTYPVADSTSKLANCAAMADALKAKVDSRRSDMDARDWQGVEEFIREEKNEAEHRNDASKVWHCWVPDRSFLRCKSDLRAYGLDVEQTSRSDGRAYFDVVWGENTQDAPDSTILRTLAKHGGVRT